MHDLTADGRVIYFYQKDEDLFMEKNLTSGSVLKTVIYFSLPYLLSYFLQKSGQKNGQTCK